MRPQTVLLLPPLEMPLPLLPSQLCLLLPYLLPLPLALPLLLLLPQQLRPLLLHPLPQLRLVPRNRSCA